MDRDITTSLAKISILFSPKDELTNYLQGMENVKLKCFKILAKHFLNCISY